MMLEQWSIHMQNKKVNKLTNYKALIYGTSYLLVNSRGVTELNSKSKTKASRNKHKRNSFMNLG